MPRPCLLYTSLVDPDLAADAGIGRVGRGKAVVDVSADGLQGDGALMTGFASGDLGAAQTAAAGALDALRAQTGRALDVYKRQV